MTTDAGTTTVLHRPGCTRPGWTVEPARSIRGVTIARCTGCGCVELRTEARPSTPQSAGSDPIRIAQPKGSHP